MRGWWQPFWVRVSAPLLREQEATLHFWLDTQEKDKSHTARFKEICSKKVKFSPQGYLKEEIEKDFWEKIEKLPSYYECKGERRIFFTLSGIRSVIDNCNKEIYESSFKDINGHILIEAVRDVYMNVVSGVRLLGYFTQDKLVERLTHVVRYGEQVKMVLYVMYPQGYDINKRSKSFYFKLFENKKGEDIKLISREGLTPNEEGRIEVALNTDYKGNNGGIRQADHPKDTPYLPRLFYCKFYNKKEDWEQDKNEIFTYPDAYGTAGDNDAYLDVQLDEKTTEQEAKEKVEGLKAKRFNYFEQLKIAKDPVVDKSLSGAGVKIGVKPEEEKKEKKHKTCYCNRDFTVEEVKSLVKAINGTDKIWDLKNCNVDDKSYERLTLELNNMFRKYGINECIQKIAFLAMTSVETGFFRTAGEIAGNTASSQYYYKGRGLLQLTGDGSDPAMYQDYKEYLGGRYDIIHNPDLVSRNIHLVVDSGGFVWKKKSVPYWNPPEKKKKESKEKYEKRLKFYEKNYKEAFEWKREKYKKGLGKNLNEVALLMKEDEETYFFLIARILQGYLPKSKDDYPKTLHYQKRKENLEKLKKWFKYDKNVCNEVDESDSERAPWMPFAISEIGQKAIAGDENNPRINDYFNASSNGKGLNEKTNWCGAFASWVFVQAGYTPPPLSCRAAMWQFWKQLDRPIYGAAAVIDWGENDLAEANGKNVGGDGHITFVVGESSDGKHYYCLGGNQGGVKGARTVKISKYEKSVIDWFVVPPSYEPTKEEYNLKIMTDETDIDNESTTRSN